MKLFYLYIEYLNIINQNKMSKCKCDNVDSLVETSVDFDYIYIQGISTRLYYKLKFKRNGSLKCI